MAKQIEYPADTVDATGKVWRTVGENIRNGSKSSEYLDNTLEKIIKEMYPIDFVIVGEVPPLVSKYTSWAPLPYNISGIGFRLGINAPTGTLSNDVGCVFMTLNEQKEMLSKLSGFQSTSIYIRFWTRVV